MYVGEATKATTREDPAGCADSKVEKTNFKVILCVAQWEKPTLKTQGSFQSYPVLKQHSWMGPNRSPSPGFQVPLTFFGRACPLFLEK